MWKYTHGTGGFDWVRKAQEVRLANQGKAGKVRQGRYIASVRDSQALGGGWETSCLPTYDKLRHWRTCVSVRDMLRGPVPGEMPPCM